MFKKLKVFIKIIFRKANLIERFMVLKFLSRKILSEYKFKWPQMMWWNDVEFFKIAEKFEGKHSNNFDRKFMVY